MKDCSSLPQTFWGSLEWYILSNHPPFSSERLKHQFCFLPRYAGERWESSFSSCASVGCTGQCHWVLSSLLTMLLFVLHMNTLVTFWLLLFSHQYKAKVKKLPNWLENHYLLTGCKMFSTIAIFLKIFFIF